VTPSPSSFVFRIFAEVGESGKVNGLRDLVEYGLRSLVEYGLRSLVEYGRRSLAEYENPLLVGECDIPLLLGEGEMPLPLVDGDTPLLLGEGDTPEKDAPIPNRGDGDLGDGDLRSLSLSSGSLAILFPLLILLDSIAGGSLCIFSWDELLLSLPAIALIR